MKIQGKIPEELGADGRRVLEEMALHVYRDYLETRWEWKIRLEQIRFITDRTTWDNHDYNRHVCFGRFNKDTKSVEIRFIDEIYEDLNEDDPTEGSKLVEECFGSFEFSKEKLGEICSRKSH